MSKEEMSVSPLQTVALTFDDAPDPQNTARTLDDLAAAGLKATFFVNTNNQMNVANDATAQALLKRIASEGHTIGSHTVDHIALDDLSTTRIEYELRGLETTLASLGIATPKVDYSKARSTRDGLPVLPMSEGRGSACWCALLCTNISQPVLSMSLEARRSFILHRLNS